MQTDVHDFIAIGLGPFNLSLACLTEPVSELSGVFLDERAHFDWHPGMLLPDATMQTPFLADLVTLADPTSPYSFLNYLKESGYLYSFYIKEDFFALRQEFNEYCQWAAQQLSTLRFNRRVEHISWQDGLYCVTARHGLTGACELYRGKKLVLGTGTHPWLPACCQPVAQQLTHSSRYLADKARLQQQAVITLIGSGQSAAEIYYDLLQDIEHHGYELNWITRSSRFFPLEYCKLSLEITSPDYIDYFHALSAASRERVIGEQACLYKGINRSLINQIYDLLYRKRLNSRVKTHLLSNTELIACQREACGQWLLTLRERDQQAQYSLKTSALVMATGYSYAPPDFLQGIQQRLAWDAAGRLDVARNFAVDKNRQEVFVQNVGLYSHGMTTPDLGMVCYRNASLIHSMLGYPVYPMEERIAVQEFGVPAHLKPWPANASSATQELSHAAL